MIPTRKAQATPPPGKAPAKRLKDDRPTPAPPQLSPREQQVCEYLSEGSTFEAIARHLNCSPAAAKAYYRRALSKRQRTIALASLQQSDSSAPRVRKAKAHPEPALAKLPCDRVASVGDRGVRKLYLGSAVEAPALRERPNPLELYVPSLFVTGDRVAAVCEQPSDTVNAERTQRRKLLPQTTITDRPQHQPRRRRSRRLSARKRRVGFAGA